MIHEQIKEAVKAAMKEKNEVVLTTLRGLMSAFTNELVAQKKRPDDEVTDEIAMTVIKRAAKQRKDSIEQFEKGGRPELAENEKKELTILEEYLPQMINKDEIRKIAESKKAELGVDDKSKMGMLMGAVMKELKDKADGGDVKEVVNSLFE